MAQSCFLRAWYVSQSSRIRALQRACAMVTGDWFFISCSFVLIILQEHLAPLNVVSHRLPRLASSFLNFLCSDPKREGMVAKTHSRVLRFVQARWEHV
jgi:hypothetical protein